MFSDENVKVSVNDFLIKAAAIALQVSSYTLTVGKQTLGTFLYMSVIMSRLSLIIWTVPKF